MKTNVFLPLSVIVLFALDLSAQVTSQSGGTAQSAPISPATNSASVRLFMEDGQLHSHPVRIFVTANILEGMDPKLKLMTSHALLKAEPGEDRWLIPTIIAPNQQEVHEIEGTKVQLAGTTLIFDLKNWPIHAIKPMTRVEPLLEWLDKPADQSTKHRAIGKTVYLGNQLIAGIYTILGVGLLIGIVIALSWSLKSGAIQILCGPDGRLSLWRVQAASWTIAISSMVLMYGLIRKEVPGIPETLVVLMGMSALTGGISHWQGSRSAPEASESANGQNEKLPRAGSVTIRSSSEAKSAPIDPQAAPPLVVVGEPMGGQAMKSLVSEATTPVAGTLPANEAQGNGADKHTNIQPTKYHFSDLICEEDANGEMQPSIPRAQLLFWTGITLSLFVAKTILEGALWDVPAQLVLLMGISQASYLGPKFFDSNKK